MDMCGNEGEFASVLISAFTATVYLCNECETLLNER